MTTEPGLLSLSFTRCGGSMRQEIAMSLLPEPGVSDASFDFNERIPKIQDHERPAGYCTS
jgi:hypothetical protein